MTSASGAKFVLVESSENQFIAQGKTSLPRQRRGDLIRSSRTSPNCNHPFDTFAGQDDYFLGVSLLRRAGLLRVSLRSSPSFLRAADAPFTSLTRVSFRRDNCCNAPTPHSSLHFNRPEIIDLRPETFLL